MREFWRQLVEASGALVVLAGIAASAYALGAEKRPRLALREAIAQEAITRFSVDSAHAVYHLKQDTVLAELKSAVDRLSRQTCYLDHRISNLPPTRECTQ